MAAAFFAAFRRLLVFAALRPAERRLRVAAAWRPAALSFLVLAAFLAAALRFRVFAAFSPALAMVGLALWGMRPVAGRFVEQNGASRYCATLTAYQPRRMGGWTLDERDTSTREHVADSSAA